MGNTSSSKSIMIAGAKDISNIGESRDSEKSWAKIKAKYIQESIENNIAIAFYDDTIENVTQVKNIVIHPCSKVELHCPIITPGEQKLEKEQHYTCKDELKDLTNDPFIKTILTKDDLMEAMVDLSVDEDLEVEDIEEGYKQLCSEYEVEPGDGHVKAKNISNIKKYAEIVTKEKDLFEDIESFITLNSQKKIKIYLDFDMTLTKKHSKGEPLLIDPSPNDIEKNIEVWKRPQSKEGHLLFDKQLYLKLKQKIPDLLNHKVELCILTRGVASEIAKVFGLILGQGIKIYTKGLTIDKHQNGGFDGYKDTYRKYNTSRYILRKPVISCSGKNKISFQHNASGKIYKDIYITQNGSASGILGNTIFVLDLTDKTKTNLDFRQIIVRLNNNCRMMMASGDCVHDVTNIEQFPNYNIHVCLKGYNDPGLEQNIQYIRDNGLDKVKVICMIDENEESLTRLANIFKNLLYEYNCDDGRININYIYIAQMLRISGLWHDGERALTRYRINAISTYFYNNLDSFKDLKDIFLYGSNTIYKMVDCLRSIYNDHFAENESHSYVFATNIQILKDSTEFKQYLPNVNPSTLDLISRKFNSFIDFSITYFEKTKINLLNNEIPDQIIFKQIQPWVVDENDYDSGSKGDDVTDDI